MKQYKVWYSHDGRISYSFHKNLEIATRRARDLSKIFNGTGTVKVFAYNPVTNRYDQEVSA